MPFAVSLILASGRSQLHLTVALLALGVIVAVAGHITATRWLIVLGIAIIAVMSALFSFVLQPGAG